MTIAAILAGKGAEVFSAVPTDSVSTVLELLARKRIGAVPVLDSDGVAGVFSERDIIRALADRGTDALDGPVSAVMTAPAVTVGVQDTVIGALALMTRRRIRHLPVVDNGRVIGIVSIGDLVKYRIDRIEADAEAMRTYIQQA
jgi:CBS domain-containing protein